MSELTDDAFDDFLYQQEVARALSKCCEKSKRFQNEDGLYECENCGDVSDI